MKQVKKDIVALKKQLVEIDKTISELTNSVKIVGELDQDRNLIISEQETWPEAVERQGKTNSLLAMKKELKKKLIEAQMRGGLQT